MLIGKYWYPLLQFAHLNDYVGVFPKNQSGTTLLSQISSPVHLI